jgi:hypothetical protein
MPDDTAVVEREVTNLPAELPIEPLPVLNLPVSLQIFFNDTLFKRCQTVANYLAKAEGYAPRHLIGKPEACFAVVSRALTWRLDPYAVAQACYQTPNGQVGYYGSLCQAIIENSGRLDPSYGGVKYEHLGDWSVLRGKFKLATGQRGGEYPVPAWEPYSAIEVGLGVIVRAKMKDEDLPREMPFDLVQAYPRNSTLWATDPRTQICYTAVRRFSTSTVPTLFMGVPFDHEDMSDWMATIRDVTPARPELADYTPQTEGETPRRRGGKRAAAAPTEDPKPASGGAPGTEQGLATGGAAAKLYFFADEYGEVHEFEDVDEAVTTYAQQLEGARNNSKMIEARWQNGARLLAALRERGHNEAADALNNEYGQLLAEAEAAAGKPAEGAAAAAESSTQPTGETVTPGVQPAAAAANETAKSDAPAYDVLVPLPAGMPANQWHMAARERLKDMTEKGRPREDFVRFREVNSAALERLKRDLRSWFNMLDEVISGSQS